MPDSRPQSPKSHAEVINRWPSLGAYADDIGITYENAKMQRRRNSIGDEYRPAVVDKARERGIGGITFELLTTTARPRSARKKRSRAR